MAHSMLHLCGYDHMEDEERLDMEEKQKEILERRGYTKMRKQGRRGIMVLAAVRCCGHSDRVRKEV